MAVDAEALLGGDDASVGEASSFFEVDPLEKNFLMLLPRSPRRDLEFDEAGAWDGLEPRSWVFVSAGAGVEPVRLTVAKVFI